MEEIACSYGRCRRNYQCKRWSRYLRHHSSAWRNVRSVRYCGSIFLCGLCRKRHQSGSGRRALSGVAQSEDSFIFVSIGSGVGAGIFLNGQLVTERTGRLGRSVIFVSPRSRVSSPLCTSSVGWNRYLAVPAFSEAGMRPVISPESPARYARRAVCSTSLLKGTQQHRRSPDNEPACSKTLS